MCLFSFISLFISLFYHKPRKWQCFPSFSCPYSRRLSEDFYALVIENKGLICYNIGNKEKESVNQLKRSCKSFGRKSKNSLQICIQKLRIRKKMKKVAGLSAIFLRPFEDAQTLVGCDDRLICVPLFIWRRDRDWLCSKPL